MTYAPYGQLPDGSPREVVGMRNIMCIRCLTSRIELGAVVSQPGQESALGAVAEWQ